MNYFKYFAKNGTVDFDTLLRLLMPQKHAPDRFKAFREYLRWNRGKSPRTDDEIASHLDSMKAKRHEQITIAIYRDHLYEFLRIQKSEARRQAGRKGGRPRVLPKQRRPRAKPANQGH